jgi:ABC-type dipeptide/oligopeptide/nickel transport system permease component
MKGYVLKRILIAIFTMFLVLTVVFFVFRLGGADPVSIMLPPDAMPKDAEKLKKKFGLDKPLVVQYFSFVKNAVRGDFGESFRYDEPALDVLIERFPATLQLGLVAFLMSVVIGLTIGILSAVKPDSLIDRFGRVFALAGMSLPSFWVAVMAAHIGPGNRPALSDAGFLPEPLAGGPDYPSEPFGHAGCAQKRLHRHGPYQRRPRILRHPITCV